MCDGYAATKCMIAEMKRTRRWWSVLRWGAGLWFVLQAVYVTIPDYPYGYRLWYWLTCDPNGYLHEMFYLVTFYVVFLWVTFELEHRALSNDEKAWKRFRRLKRGA